MSKREPVSFLVFSASLRAGSFNTTLAKLAAGTIEQHGGTVDLAAMSAFDSPSYSQDAQAQGFPTGATELGRQGKIANQQLADRFDQTIAGFMDLAEAAKHYPCAKTAWIEFLGEHPNSPIDRVEKPAQPS